MSLLHTSTDHTSADPSHLNFSRSTGCVAASICVCVCVCVCVCLCMCRRFVVFCLCCMCKHSNTKKKFMRALLSGFSAPSAQPGTNKQTNTKTESWCRKQLISPYDTFHTIPHYFRMITFFLFFFWHGSAVARRQRKRDHLHTKYQLCI